MFGGSFHCRFNKVTLLKSRDNIFPIWALTFTLASGWEKLDIINLAISPRASGHAPKLPETVCDERASQLSEEQ